MAYSNGRFPLSLFVHRGGNIYLTPSLNARWDEMVRLALEKYRVRLWITGDIDGLGGWNGYRPWDAQGRYKNHYGRGAAAQGFSSHGGVYQGREVFALDIGNVDALAPGNASLAHARLTALAQAVGLTVNFVSPSEWWHVGDFNNAWVVPTFGTPAINHHTTNVPEEDDMKATYIYSIGLKGQRNAIYAIAGNGMVERWDSKDGVYNTEVAAAFDLAGPPVQVTESQFDVTMQALAQVRTGTA